MTNKKKNILFVLHLPPPVHGAAVVGKYIHDSRLINESFNCRYINLAMAENLETIGKFSFAKIFNLFRIIKLIRQEMRLFSPHLVYVTPNASGGAFYKDFIVVQAIKAFGGNIVMHFHNKGVEKNSHHFINNFLYKQFFKTTKVILLSESLYSDLGKYVKKEDVSYCGNGIPDCVVDKAGHNERCRILYLSNLIISKGVLDLLDACKILIEREMKFECVFVGAETDEMTSCVFLEEVNKRHLENHVRYLGKKYGDDKDAEFNRADIFAFPTYYPNECFPIVLLEAMQHGLPCISTNEGAIPDIIESGETGFIINRHAPNEMADAICKLIESKSLRQLMGSAARNKYEKLYRLETFEHTLSSILYQLV